ncbi:MAG: competence/damage-inducible protein A [Anaerolineae bacterium]
MPTASLLAIGNELLNGAVRDTNLFSLSQNLTRMGFSVEYTAMVRDIPQKIADVVLFLLAQQPDVLLCSGGLGPTEDDLTLPALAEALHMPLAFDSTAADLVESHYDRLLAQHYLTQRGPAFAREKMATLPLGAQPLPNPVGTAPGVKMEHQKTTIYVLPGVPAELEAIFAASIAPELLRRFTPGIWAEHSMLVYCDDEADLAIPLRDVAQRHPEVYLKSLAKPFPAASTEGLRVIAVALAATESEAHAAAQETLNDLHRTAEAAGLPVGESSSSTN